jgi:hypothetical protein
VGVGCRERPPGTRAAGAADAANVRVSAGANPFVEATIAAHPRDPTRLVATASELVKDRGSRPRAFVSSDGGHGWSLRALPGIDERARTGRLAHAFNNWVVFSPGGRAYLSTLTSNGVDKEVLVYRSSDGGLSWAGPAQVPSRGLDFPTMSVGLHRGRERLYLAATGSGRANRHLTDAPDARRVFPIFTSDDGGETFQVASVVSAPDEAPGRLGYQAMNLVAAPAERAVPFLAFGIGPGPNAARLHLVRSHDAGAHFGPPEAIVARPPAPPATATLAADRQGPGWYAAWTTLVNGVERVLVARARAGGWQVALIEPAPGRPHFPTIAVGPQGTVGVAWLQATGAQRTCTRVGFSVSRDGGASFSPPRWPSPLACADPTINADWPIIAAAPGGEYMGIAAAADGAFHVIWADGREGPFQVYTTRIAPLE